MNNIRKALDADLGVKPDIRGCSSSYPDSAADIGLPWFVSPGWTPVRSPLNGGASHQSPLPVGLGEQGPGDLTSLALRGGRFGRLWLPARMEVCFGVP
jgi:hypothetical protein